MDEIITKEMSKELKLKNMITNIGEKYRSEETKDIVDLTKTLLEIFEDRDIKQTARMDNFNKRVDGLEGKIDITYNRTNTIQFNGRARELSNVVLAKAYKFSGNKGSLGYILFYDKFTFQIYKEIKEKYSVNSYGDLKLEDLEDCLKLVSEWKPEKNAKRKILHDYQKMYDKSALKSKTKAFEMYIEEIGGI